MNQVLEFFRKLFDTSGWPPRWHCGNWSEFHGWLYIISDLLIWSAYFAIPLAILKFVNKRRLDLRFVRAYFLFAAFILACGATHLLDAVAFWFPAYRLNALIRFITGVVSWITVFYIIKSLPAAMQLRSNTALEKEIEEKEKAEDKLRLVITQLNEAQDLAKLGHWQWDVATNKITWSEGLFKIYDMQPTAEGFVYEEYLSRIHPEDRDKSNKSIQEALATKQFAPFLHRIVLPDGTVKMIQGRGEVVCNEAGEITSMLGTAQDITEQYKTQQQLMDKTIQLEASNMELQKFAYVASHDLQEPLRKILTFSSLLDHEKEAVTEKNKMYFDKIVFSATRMQKLIDDLLQFSRLNTDAAAYEKVDLNAVIKAVLQDLEVTIEQTRASITIDILPVIDGRITQLEQLFSNLLRNAIKFHKQNAIPVVHISSHVSTGDKLLNNSLLKVTDVDDSYWKQQEYVKIEVKDSGIGFEPTYAEKIFEIFQRLHSGKLYQGTGIGLAICKKVVDNHHGFIYASGEADKGAVFTIILPLLQPIS